MRRLRRWVYDHGFRYYCHRCDRVMWWTQQCKHKSRWWRG